MPLPIYFLAFALMGYLLGSVPFAVIVSRLFGLADPRSHGSGNPGATNVLRTGNKAAAVLTLLGDAGKGWFAMWLAGFLGGTPTAVAIAGLAAFLGHVFPVFLRFKGGKGVATALGAILAFQPAMVLPALAVFLAAVLIWRYISLGSILAAVTLFLTALGLAGSWAYPPPPPGTARWPGLLAWGLLVALVIYKHKGNLVRLAHGTESRFWGAGR